MFSSVFLFFEFGAGEIMFIMLVALLLFGGDKLPELARGLGKGIRDFKDASEGVKREITNQIDNFEAKKTEQAAAKTTDETPVAANESLITNEKPVLGPPDNVVPVAEISATEEVEPVKNEADSKPEHLKETPIDVPAKTTHEEYKS